MGHGQYYKAGGNWGGVLATLANPVEHISWDDCERWLPRCGLILPSEAQWEYGCRAGTTSPWVCPLDELRLYANVADATAKRVISVWDCEAWSDDHVVHAPVGSFRANDFGLHDMHGNVWEWTHDGYSLLPRPPRVGDGLRGDPADSGLRVSRGGGFGNPGRGARSAIRDKSTRANRGGVLGARVARSIAS